MSAAHRARLAKSEQFDNWIFRLTAASMIAANQELRLRSAHAGRPPGREEVGEVAQRFDVHPNQITQRKGAIAISMDCKGSWRDNVFVERLWRGLKCEEV